MKESKSCAARFNSHYFPKATILVVAFFLTFSLSGQIYKSAVGLRASYGGLLSYEHSLNENIMAEGIVSFRWKGVIFTALIERYTPAFTKENLYWYYGGGLHLGFCGRDNTINPPPDANTTTYINLGMDLIGGLDYRFEKIPFAASVDYLPSFYFTGDRWFVGEGIGLSLRYIID